jgi:lysozyme
VNAVEAQAAGFPARWLCGAYDDCHGPGLRRRPAGIGPGLRGRRLFGPLSQAKGLPHPRHRRVQVPGRHDWNAVVNSGVKFAWIKATEGGDLDARFQANWEGAKAAGIPHGAYHFVYWCRPPLEEIQIFEQNAPAEDDALPPVLDAEATPTSPTCHRHLTQDGAIADMQVMLQEMERHYGKRPIIYTTVDFYQAILSDGALTDYPIWVRSTKHHPAVKFGARAWHFWQYQSDGRVPGIGGKVDKDVFYGTKDQWDAFRREPGVRPVQTGAAAPAPAQTAEVVAD